MALNAFPLSRQPESQSTAATVGARRPNRRKKTLAKALQAALSPAAVSEEVYGQKSIGQWGSFIYLVNQIFGAGILALPLVLKESGWLPCLAANVLVCVVAMEGTLMLMRAMTMVKGNQNFERRLEYIPTIKYFLGPVASRLTEFAFYISIQSLNVLSITIVAQSFDHMLLKVLDFDAGLVLSRTGIHATLFREQAEVDRLYNGSSGFMIGITLGYLINAAICIVLSAQSMEDNMNLQYVSFAFLISSVVQLTGNALWKVFTSPHLLAVAPLQGLGSSGGTSGDHQTGFLGKRSTSFSPMFRTSSAAAAAVRLPRTFGHYQYGQLLSTFVASYSYNNMIPSWANEMQPTVNVEKAVRSSSLFTCVVYYIFGYLLACAYPEVSSDNILEDVLRSPTTGDLTKASVYVFNLLTVLPGILVFSITTRYNLVNSGQCTPRKGFLLGVLLPFGLAWLFSNNKYFAAMLQWSSLLFSLAVNFLVPAAIYVLACGGQRMAARNPTRHLVQLLRYARRAEGCCSTLAAHRARPEEGPDLTRQLRQYLEALPSDELDPDLRQLMRQSTTLEVEGQQVDSNAHTISPAGSLSASSEFLHPPPIHFRRENKSPRTTEDAAAKAVAVISLPPTNLPRTSRNPRLSDPSARDAAAFHLRHAAKPLVPTPPGSARRVSFNDGSHRKTTSNPAVVVATTTRVLFRRNVRSHTNPVRQVAQRPAPADRPRRKSAPRLDPRHIQTARQSQNRVTTDGDNYEDCRLGAPTDGSSSSSNSSPLLSHCFSKRTNAPAAADYASVDCGKAKLEQLRIPLLPSGDGSIIAFEKGCASPLLCNNWCPETTSFNCTTYTPDPTVSSDFLNENAPQRSLEVSHLAERLAGGSRGATHVGGASPHVFDSSLIIPASTFLTPTVSDAVCNGPGSGHHHSTTSTAAHQGQLLLQRLAAPMAKLFERIATPIETSPIFRKQFLYAPPPPQPDSLLRAGTSPDLASGGGFFPAGGFGTLPSVRSCTLRSETGSLYSHNCLRQTVFNYPQTTILKATSDFPGITVTVDPNAVPLLAAAADQSATDQYGTAAEQAASESDCCLSSDVTDQREQFVFSLPEKDISLFSSSSSGLTPGGGVSTINAATAAIDKPTCPTLSAHDSASFVGSNPINFVRSNIASTNPLPDGGAMSPIRRRSQTLHHHRLPQALLDDLSESQLTAAAQQTVLPHQGDISNFARQPAAELCNSSSSHLHLMSNCSTLDNGPRLLMPPAPTLTDLPLEPPLDLLLEPEAGAEDAYECDERNVADLVPIRIHVYPPGLLRTYHLATTIILVILLVTFCVLSVAAQLIVNELVATHRLEIPAAALASCLSEDLGTQQHFGGVR